VDYGRPADWLEGEGADNLAVIVDFTPEGDDPAGVLAEMRNAYGAGLVWIDHHEAAIGRAGAANHEIRGVRRAGAAACRLAWKYFFPGEPEPRAVELLGRYDVFDRSDTDEWWKVVLPFNFGLRLHATDPAHTEGVWRPLLDKVDVDRLHYDVIRSGEVHLLVLKRQNEAFCGMVAFDCVFQGMLCCAVNARGNSLVLDAYARPEHKMRILWAFNGRAWKVSLYENGHVDVHCGELAARFGGGGHAGAAGFELPPERPPLEVFDRVEKGEAGVDDGGGDDDDGGRTRRSGGHESGDEGGEE